MGHPFIHARGGSGGGGERRARQACLNACEIRSPWQQSTPPPPRVASIRARHALRAYRALHASRRAAETRPIFTGSFVARLPTTSLSSREAASSRPCPRGNRKAYLGMSGSTFDSSLFFWKETGRRLQRHSLRPVQRQAGRDGGSTCREMKEPTPLPASSFRSWASAPPTSAPCPTWRGGTRSASAWPRPATSDEAGAAPKKEPQLSANADSN